MPRRVKLEDGQQHERSTTSRDVGCDAVLAQCYPHVAEAATLPRPLPIRVLQVVEWVLRVAFLASNGLVCVLLVLRIAGVHHAAEPMWMPISFVIALEAVALTLTWVMALVPSLQVCTTRVRVPRMFPLPERVSPH